MNSKHQLTREIWEKSITSMDKAERIIIKAGTKATVVTFQMIEGE